jgi:hypothetical protein
MMRWKPVFIAASAIAILAPVSSLAGMQVRFVGSDRYTDAGSFESSRRSTEAALRAHLDRLGKRYLAPGQSLSIDVLDIDLAGQNEPLRFGLSDMRVLRGVTPPRIRLRYVWSEKGRRIRSGEETLSDINYQMNPSAQLSSDRYVYEKALLDDWFRRTFSERRIDRRHDF